MRRGAAVVGAVAGGERERLAVELEIDAALDDETQLLGVAVRIGDVSGRAPRLELRRDDLERLEGLRRQERLATEGAPRNRVTVTAAHDPRPGRSVLGE